MSRPFSRYAIQRVESDIMIMPTSTISGLAGWLCIRLGAAICCAVAADWLFYGHSAGLSFAIFLALLACVSVWLNPPRLGDRVAYLLFAAGQLAILEDLNFLSASFGLIGLVAVTLARKMDGRTEWRAFVPLTALTIVSGPVRLARDCLRVHRSMHREASLSAVGPILLTWIVPLGLGAVFLALFQDANPLIAQWVPPVDLRSLLALISAPRISFWVFVVVTIWPVIHVRIARAHPPNPAVASRLDAVLPSSDQNLFGEAAIRRSLVLFNVLFAVQSALDLTYLWGGASLPEGMTYATYAHRGAYPLLATALLAGAFVLLAMRSSGTVPLIRVLLLAWTGQNILLVLSSIFRLNLYVAAYSLTEWRVAAFIWMALVAAGLCSIVVRIVLAKSSAWLITANGAVLALTLYGCCFIDFPSTVAEYNVRHATECRGHGRPLDISYLLSLPPRVLLALDICGSPLHVMAQRDRWVALHLAEHRDWRGWSFREWRLDRYLANVHWTP